MEYSQDEVNNDMVICDISIVRMGEDIYTLVVVRLVANYVGYSLVGLWSWCWSPIMLVVRWSASPRCRSPKVLVVCWSARDNI